VVARRPDHTTDMLGVIAGTSDDLRLDPLAVRRQGRVELGIVVVGGNHNVTTPAPLRIEPVVVENASPDRVVTRIHPRRIPDVGHEGHASGA
jgi:hypothetical protein